VLSNVGSFTNIRGGNAYPGIIRESEKKPLRVFLVDGRNDLRGERKGGYDQTWDWFLQNNRMKDALLEKGYDLNYSWGIQSHGQSMLRAVFPDMMRWLWRDQPVSTDPKNMTERSFAAPAKTESPAPSSDETALLEVEHRWAAALVKGDAAALDSILSDTFSGTDEHGTPAGKSGKLAVLRSGDLKMSSIDLSGMKVSLYGDCAVVTGVAVEKPRTAFTDTFVFQGGKWMAVASHESTPLAR
jgi:hypothetical protein